MHQERHFYDCGAFHASYLTIDKTDKYDGFEIITVPYA